MLNTVSNVPLDESVMKEWAVKFVKVGEFTEDSKNEFVKDCDEVLNSGQAFLPINIDSYGGQIYALVGMIDYLKGVNVPIYTYCDSKAMSCGAMLFSMGERRIMSELATVLYHDMSWGVIGKDTDIQTDAEYSKKLKKAVNETVDKSLGKKKGFLAEKLLSIGNADWSLTAKEALKEEIATDIGTVHLTTRVEVAQEMEIG